MSWFISSALSASREDNRNNLPGGVEMSPNIFREKFISCPSFGSAFAFVLFAFADTETANKFYFCFLCRLLALRMSFLTSLSCEVTQSKLFPMCCSLSWFISEAETLRSFVSNNCYDLCESIADTPKRSINEFLFSSLWGTWRSRKSANSATCVWRVFDCYVCEVNKLLRCFSICFWPLV